MDILSQNCEAVCEAISKFQDHTDVSYDLQYNGRSDLMVFNFTLNANAVNQVLFSLMRGFKDHKFQERYGDLEIQLNINKNYVFDPDIKPVYGKQCQLTMFNTDKVLLNAFLERFATILNVWVEADKGLDRSKPAEGNKAIINKRKMKAFA